MRYALVTNGLVQALDANDNVVFSQLVDKQGNSCIPVDQDDEYRIYRLRVLRGDEQYPPLRVHFKGGKQARILGIERLER